MGLLKSALRKTRSRLLSPMVAQGNTLDRLLLLEGKQASQAGRSCDRLAHLSDAEFRVFSQWGEDGILDWLIERLPIQSPRFIEFGVGDYRESNTRFLLMHRNWKGLIIDSGSEWAAALRDQDLYWRHDLTAVNAWISRDNINDIFNSHGFAAPIGVLSIDIDGNDYWVWQAIQAVQADIVVCEYNAVFGDLYPISVPYDARFNRAQAHHSHLYFGASIGALVQLARQKGYELAGTNLAGSNAFFVRKELFAAVDAQIASKAPMPSLARESRASNGQLNFISGCNRTAEIADLPVVRVDTGEIQPIRALGKLFSPEWLRRMCIAEDEASAWNS